MAESKRCHVSYTHGYHLFIAPFCYEEGVPKMKAEMRPYRRTQVALMLLYYPAYKQLSIGRYIYLKWAKNVRVRLYPV